MPEGFRQSQGIEVAEFAVLPVGARKNSLEPAAARCSAEVFARENAARSRKERAAEEQGNRFASRKGHGGMFGWLGTT